MWVIEQTDINNLIICGVVMVGMYIGYLILNSLIK